jgi:hypothetical protein
MAMSAVERTNITTADMDMNHCVKRLFRNNRNMQMQKRIKCIPEMQINYSIVVKVIEEKKESNHIATFPPYRMI